MRSTCSSVIQLRTPRLASTASRTRIPASGEISINFSVSKLLRTTLEGVRLRGSLSYLFVRWRFVLWQRMHSSLGGWLSPRANSIPAPWQVRQYSTLARSTCTTLSGMRPERSPLMSESPPTTMSTNVRKNIVCMRGGSLFLSGALSSIARTVYHMRASQFTSGEARDTSRGMLQGIIWTTRGVSRGRQGADCCLNEWILFIIIYFFLISKG